MKNVIIAGVLVILCVICGIFAILARHRWNRFKLSMIFIALCASFVIMAIIHMQV